MVATTATGPVSGQGARERILGTAYELPEITRLSAGVDQRMLTVVQTLRLRHRSVLAYLEQAITAHRLGEPAPKLLG